MERTSHNDFVIHAQPWLMARALRAVLREDPAVIKCTAHKLVSDGTTWRLHIDAADPLQCLLNATQIIKQGLLANRAPAGNTRNALLNG